MGNVTRKPTRAFADGEGRRWTLKIDVGRAMQVRDALDVDLLRAETEQTILELARDPITLCAVIWILIADQAGQAGVDRDQFWDGMSDDSIEAATFAFLDALIDFFPTRRQGPLRAIVRKMRDAGEKQLAHVEAAAAAGRIDQAIDRQLERATAAFDAELERILADHPTPTPGA